MHRIDRVSNARAVFEKPRRIFHGTSTQYLDAILANGLTPRPRHAQGNFPTIPSQPGYVYLTTTWAIWYAISAREGEYDPCVIEIDLSKLNACQLYPDEDYLRQQSVDYRKRRGNKPADWTGKLKTSQRYWQRSLEKLGNVAYKATVPPDAITRSAIISDDRCPRFLMSSYTCAVNIGMYPIVGEMLRNMIHSIFDGVPLDYDLMSQLRGFVQRLDPEALQDWNGYLARLAQEAREGIATLDN